MYAPCKVNISVEKTQRKSYLKYQSREKSYESYEISNIKSIRLLFVIENKDRTKTDCMSHKLSI